MPTLQGEADDSRLCVSVVFLSECSCTDLSVSESQWRGGDGVVSQCVCVCVCVGVRARARGPAWCLFGADVCVRL